MLRMSSSVDLGEVGRPSIIKQVITNSMYNKEEDNKDRDRSEFYEKKLRPRHSLLMIPPLNLKNL